MAYQLVDMLRFGDPWIDSDQITDLLSLEALPKSVIDSILDFIPPDSGVAWASACAIPQTSPIRYVFF